MVEWRTCNNDYIMPTCDITMIMQNMKFSTLIRFSKNSKRISRKKELATACMSSIIYSVVF